MLIRVTDLLATYTVFLSPYPAFKPCFCNLKEQGTYMYTDNMLSFSQIANFVRQVTFLHFLHSSTDWNYVIIMSY